MTRMLGAVLGLALALGSSQAFAATISNLSGQSCGAQSGNWHFIQNKIPAGSGTGTLIAVIGGATCTAVGQPVGNGQTQHFNCNGFSGELTSAYTNIDGKLVLSDFSCSQPPKTEDCKDGIDNDGDGLVDGNDPDCQTTKP